ncbi:hypothetical protein [Streptomyces vinaceus]|uniref:hypothetical protein n=1 Tax=Streptomyces vinaceus TaxID=1960 RepID=UPI0035DD0551
MKSDLTAAHRNEIGQHFYGKGQRSGELTSNSIGDKDAAGRSSQLWEDLTAIAAHDDAKLATAVLGSYTANYEILREGVNGVQARITITNGMTVSSFVHAKTGYGTPADKSSRRMSTVSASWGTGRGRP